MGPDEIFRKLDDALLSRLSEDRRIERKTASFAPSDIGDYIDMWANTSPDGGILVLGMHDKGGFEGCNKLSTKQMNEREKCGQNFCPDARVETKRVSVVNKDGIDDFVIVFRVWFNPDRVVYTTARKVFFRSGDSKFEANAERIRELKADRGEISFEQQPCGLAYPEGFREEAISQYASKVQKARGMSEDLTAVEILEIRRLGTITDGVFVPNVACMLLFAKDPLVKIPGCKVHFQRFDGEHEKTGERYNVVKDMILEGCVSELISKTEVVLDSQLRTFSPLDSKGKFFPVPEYPKKAWYEAVVNACVHRSYGNGMRNRPIFVKMFDDRLVIESPGPFPPSVNSENIYNTHDPRNPQLMDALFYLELVKCSHEGTRRIRDLMAEMKLPTPEFVQSDTGHSMVRVTLRNNIKQRRTWIDRDVGNIISEALASDLTEVEIRALNWTAEYDKITITNAQRLLDVSWEGARKILLELARKKIFQYVRFRKLAKDSRDPRAHFRLRSPKPFPKGGFEQPV